MSINDYIWYEKYRPKTMNEIVLEESVKESFDKYVEEQSIPHLLLHGCPGSGKTTIASILLNEIPNKSLTLNASSKDRGVDTVKTTIADFVKSKAIGGKLKIVFLDEADGLTNDAQFALKNLMETYSSTCRFILTANVVGKVIAPIQSRCTQFQFGQYPIGQMLSNLINILKEENIEFDRRKVSAMVNRLYPDFRSIVNAAQQSSISGVFKMSAGSAGSVKLSELVDNLLHGKLREIRESITGVQDYTFIYRYLFDNFIIKEVDEDLRGDVAIAIAQHLANDAMVADKEINFCSCLITIMNILEIKPKF